MKTHYISLGPLLIFALLVMLIEAASSAPPVMDTVNIHIVDAAFITFYEGEACDEDSL